MFPSESHNCIDYWPDPCPRSFHCDAELLDSLWNQLETAQTQERKDALRREITQLLPF